MDHVKSEKLGHDSAWLATSAPKIHTTSGSSAAPSEIPVAATTIGNLTDESNDTPVTVEELGHLATRMLSELIERTPPRPEPIVRPPPPEGTMLARIFSPIRVAASGIVLRQGIYDSAALRLLARQTIGPIFVNVADDLNSENVFVRAADSWITVPRVGDAE